MNDLPKIEPGLQDALEKELSLTMRHSDIRGPAPAENDQQMVDKLLGSGDRILRLVRKQILDAEQDYQRALMAIVHRAEDETASLKASHMKRLVTLRTTLRKIEAIRDA